MNDLFGADERVDSALKELRREHEMRSRVYPRWVQEGRMRQDVADRQMRGLDDAIALLEDRRR